MVKISLHFLLVMTLSLIKRISLLWMLHSGKRLLIMNQNPYYQITLGNLLICQKPIGCKWIFKRKLKPDGSLDKFKARLIAKGYTQKKDFDYFNTFAHVTKIASIKVLFALAFIHKVVIHQMDVKTAIFNGKLEEKIYMDQPEGCITTENEHKVCKLVIFIWFKTSTQTMT